MTSILNGLDAKELENDINMLKNNPSRCRIAQKLQAEWVGGYRARIYFGDRELYIGGEGNFSAMAVTHASLLACEIGVIAQYATLRGIELEELKIEGVGDFDITRLMNVGNDPSPGFQKINFNVKIKAKNATPEQLQDLVKICETVSPVGDTITREVPFKLNFEIM